MSEKSKPTRVFCENEEDCVFWTNLFGFSGSSASRLREGSNKTSWRFTHFCLCSEERETQRNSKKPKETYPMIP